MMILIYCFNLIFSWNGSKLQFRDCYIFYWIIFRGYTTSLSLLSHHMLERIIDYTNVIHSTNYWLRKNVILLLNIWVVIESLKIILLGAKNEKLWCLFASSSFFHLTFHRYTRYLLIFTKSSSSLINVSNNMIILLVEQAHPNCALFLYQNDY